MSRPQKSKKTTKVTRKQTKLKSKAKTGKQLFSPQVSSYIFLGTLFFLFCKFTASLAAEPDFMSPILKGSGWIFWVDIGAAFLLTIAFGFFGWRHFNGRKELVALDKSVLIAALVAIGVLYVASFTNEISPNGDNGEYLIAAKSLVERGAVYRLETLNENANTLAALGLPLLLAPIYAIWGFDIFKMKVLIMAIAIFTVVLFFLLFRKKVGNFVGALLTIAVATSPYLIGDAKSIMTESPYLMWSVFTLIVILKFHESQSFDWKYFVLSLAGVVMTYLTRTIGIGTLIAMLGFLSLYVDWKGLFSTNRRKAVLGSLPFRRLIFLLGPLLLVGLTWQIWQAAHGISQVEILFDGGIKDRFIVNFSASYRVIAQMLIDPGTFKFLSLHDPENLIPSHFLHFCILTLMIIGLVRGIIAKDLLPIYAFVIYLLVMAASLTSQEMVIIRYLSVVVPFMVYLTFYGAREISERVAKPLGLGVSSISDVLPFLLLAQMMFVNVTANNTNIILSEVGNGPTYLDYVDVAKWSAKNLPEDAFVMSIKPRLFYVLSNKKGMRSTTTSEVYSKEFEAEKIASMLDAGVTHVIIDGMSGSSRKNIRPIVQNNPDLFQTMYLGGIAGTASVVKVRKTERTKVN